MITLKEKALAKVKELDQRMAELNASFENEKDPEKKSELSKEILSVVALTNKYLRMAGADVKEMYVE